MVRVLVLEVPWVVVGSLVQVTLFKRNLLRSLLTRVPLVSPWSVGSQVSGSFTVVVVESGRVSLV